MLVVGLTGGIAMGKTTLSRMLSKRGIPVVDADAIVHQLYSEGGRAVPAVRAAFPSAVIADRVDRTRLASLVVGRKDEFKDYKVQQGITYSFTKTRLVSSRANQEYPNSLSS